MGRQSPCIETSSFRQNHLNEFLVIHFSFDSMIVLRVCARELLSAGLVKWARACAIDSHIFFFVFVLKKNILLLLLLLPLLFRIVCVPIVCEFEVCLYILNKKAVKHTFLLDEFFPKLCRCRHHIAHSLVFPLYLSLCGTMCSVCVTLWPIFIFGMCSDILTNVV